MKPLTQLQEEILKEFEEKFVKRDTLDFVGEWEDVELFLLASNKKVLEWCVEKIKEFEITSGVLGEKVSNPTMRVGDVKKMLLSSLREESKEVCGETHTSCDSRLEKEKGLAQCCYCVPHDGCVLKHQESKEKA